MKALRLITIYVLLSSLVLSACGKGGAPLGSGADESKLHFKNALIALDAGDDAQAENELRLSLSANPTNHRARTALASLIAKQAGITLHDWLDPFWKTAAQLRAYSMGYDRASEVVSYLESQYSDQKLTKDEQVDLYFSKLASMGAKYMIAAGAILDLFTNIPYLSPGALEKLDSAIRVLRDEDSLAQYRSEDVRIYLSILSFTRLTVFSRKLIGDKGGFNMDEQRVRLCAMDKLLFMSALSEVKKSLGWLEEGLATNDADSKNSMENSKEKLREFVTGFLVSETWEKLDDAFDDKTLEGKAAKELSYQFCKAEKLGSAVADETQKGIDTTKQAIGNAVDTTVDKINQSEK